MGQIIGGAAKPKRCNANQLSQVPTPAAGEYILVSSDNSMNAAGQGNFDAYVEGDGVTAATALELKKIDDLYQYMDATLHKSKNLFDKSKAQSGKYINRTTGAVASASGYYASDYIPVSENGLYITNFYEGGTAIGAAVYNTSKAFVRRLSSASYTYVEGDGYIRFSIRGSSNLDAAQVEEGDSPSSYEAYYTPYYTYMLKESVIPPMTTELTETDFYKTEIGRNILDNSQIKDGYYIDRNNGVEVSQSDYSVTPFIPMNGKNVCCVYATNYGVAGGTAVYNSQKQFVRGSQDDRGIFFVEGDAFVRFTIKTSNKNIACAAYYDQTPRYFPFSAYQEKNVIDTTTIPSDIHLANCAFSGVEAGKNKFNKEQVVQGFILTSTGNVKTSTQDFALTDYIRVSKNGLCSNLQGADTLYFCVLDANMNVLRVSHGSSYTYVSGDAYIRFSFLYSQLSTLQIEEGSTPTAYEAYTEKRVISPDVIPSGNIAAEDIAPAVSELGINTDLINVFLPDKLYAVVGDTLQVFYKSLIQAVEPLRYNVLVSCSKGAQYHRYWEYTPSAADVGTTTFRVTIKDDNGNVLGTAQSSLVTTAAPSSPASNKNVLCVGDSTTAGGQWVTEFARRLTGSGGSPAGKSLSNISFVGSMVKDGVHFEGHSGWAWGDYTTAGRGGAAFRFYLSAGTAAIGDVYSNNSHNYEVVELQEIEGVNTILCSTSSSSNTPSASGTLTKVSGTGDATLTFSSASQDSSNPFWDSVNNKMTFVPYANSYCNGTIDAVYVLLGANGQSAWRVDFSTMMAQVKTFADTLHSEFPNATLKILSLQLPSMVNMMKGYGASGSGYADTYGMLVTLFRMRQQYQDFANQTGYEFVEFVDIAAEFDGDYNYPLTQKNVNTRNSSVQEPYDNNTLHPSLNGYYQYADCAYRNFVAKFCQ